MKKVGDEVEADLLAIINSSALKTAIKGTVYKKGLRPVNAITEDVVVYFMTGLDGQNQTGVLNVNIFVPNIDNGGTVKVKDGARCKALAVLGQALVDSLSSTEYDFSLSSTIQSFSTENDQYFVNIKLDYKRATY